ncbi:MAG: hypothetical protein JXP34_01435 [Planctomycetes bacterium]|nr:hypothetical protein [Planctomycetota bacterium]
MMGALLALALAAAQADAVAAPRFRPDELPVGRRAVVVGTYAESIDGEIRIDGLSAGLRVDESQSRALLALKAGRDNVRIELERTAGGLRVISIGPGPADAELFAAEVARTDPSDVEGLFALGTAILRREAAGSSGLSGVRARLVEKLIARADAEKGSPSRRFEILSRLATSIGDEASLRALAQFASEHPAHDGARDLLVRRGYVFSKGAWRSAAEYRDARGYVLDDHEWIPRREFLFRVRIRELSAPGADLLSPRLTNEIFQRHAKAGRVVPGMNRAETVLAWGWPDAVHRRVVDGVTFDQWIYPERNVYLRGGLVAATETSDGKPLPAPAAETSAPHAASQATVGAP